MPEKDSANSPQNKTILFHIFEYISKLLNHSIRPIKYGKKCSECNQLKSDDEIGKIYTNKGLELI